MSLGILFGIGGMLMIILSGVVDDLEDSWLNEHVIRILGFMGIAGCGLVFALYSIFVFVFHPKEEAKPSPRPSAEGESGHKPKPVAALIMSAIATIMFFVCAAFFAIGSFIPGITSYQGGIGAALIGACLLQLAEIIEKSYDPSKQDIVDEVLEDLLEPMPSCDRCGIELKSRKAKICFSCGYEWK